MLTPATADPQPPVSSFLNERQAAALLNLSPATLRTWRARRRPDGPPFLRFGAAVRYDAAALRAWASRGAATAPTNADAPGGTIRGRAA